MIQSEFQNNKELEADKACKTSETADVSSLNKFLFNILSDQVKISVDFNS